MYQFALPKNSDKDQAAKFIADVKLAQMIRIYGNSRVLQPENHKGRSIHIAHRQTGAKFNSKSSVLLLILTGNTSEDIEREVESYIKQDYLALSWPYYFIGFVRCRGGATRKEFQLTLQSTLELDPKPILSQWLDMRMFRQVLSENCKCCSVLYGSI
jgi:hypothetical protein